MYLSKYRLLYTTTYWTLPLNHMLNRKSHPIEANRSPLPAPSFLPDTLFRWPICGIQVVGLTSLPPTSMRYTNGRFESNSLCQSVIGRGSFFCWNKCLSDATIDHCIALALWHCRMPESTNIDKKTKRGMLIPYRVSFFGRFSRLTRLMLPSLPLSFSLLERKKILSSYR